VQVAWTTHPQPAMSYSSESVRCFVAAPAHKCQGLLNSRASPLVHVLATVPSCHPEQHQQNVHVDHSRRYHIHACMHHPVCCWSLPRNSAEKYASKPCLGWRVPQGPDGKSLGPYTFMTYKEAWDKAVQVMIAGSSRPHTRTRAPCRGSAWCCWLARQ
jgi:hypothetical protein